MRACPRPIRILHITPSSELGGGPEHVWQLVRNLPNGGPDAAESFIAAPERGLYWPRFMEAVGRERLFAIPQRRFSFGSFFALLRWVKKQRIDIIHSHGRGGGVYGRPLALLAGAKNVHTFHGIHVPEAFFRKQAYCLLERILGTVSGVFITVSRGERDYALSLLRLPEKRIHLIRNGVAVADFPPGSRAEPFRVVHVTRFDPVKNSPWLVPLALGLRDAGKLESCRFVIIGDGEGRPAMRQAVVQAGLEAFFTFTGAVQNPREYFRGAGCCLSASSREGLPLAVLESQSEGVPGVVSDVAGNREAVANGETGFLYPLGDVAAAVACLGRLMDDDALWTGMAAAAHQRAKKFFSVERMAAETVLCYTALSLRKMHDAPRGAFCGRNR